MISRRQLLTSLAGLGAIPFSTAQAKEAAQAVAIDAAGVANLHRLTPTLYRGAQPTREGFAYLAERLGVKTVLSLRHNHSDRRHAAGTPLTLHRVPINTWHIGDDRGAKIVRALRLLRHGEQQGPVFVHCQHGSDRTGAIIALYRILYQGVDKETAIAEMQKGGFGFHAVWAALPVWGNIPSYIRRVDVADLKRRIEA